MFEIHERRLKNIATTIEESVYKIVHESEENCMKQHRVSHKGQWNQDHVIKVNNDSEAQV